VRDAPSSECWKSVEEKDANNMDNQQFQAVIVGSGLAGLTCAIELVEQYGYTKVALVTKGSLSEGAASLWAQGGVAVALSSDDNPALHAEDTLKVGGGLNHVSVVHLLAQEGPVQVRQIIERGAIFDRDSDGEYVFAREAAHCRRRVLHAKDATGAEMVRALVSYMRTLPADRITVFEHAFGVDLAQQNQVTQGLWISQEGNLKLLSAPVVVLASGGAGQVFSYTTNPGAATGDGIALAYRAGARLRDLEFFQFHPTALDIHQSGLVATGPAADESAGWSSLPLITEALRGDGAVLVDETGERFTNELLPRDQVARAIWKHRRDGHHTYLDARGIENFAERFPTVFASCQKWGVDPQTQLMPVVPAAHYYMGGVEIDCWGRTSVAGLWACGEVGNGGVHGANRLASNSLLEALVFGARVAENVGQMGSPTLGGSTQVNTPQLVDDNPLIIRRLRDIMWDKVGLARQQAGLQEAKQQLASLGTTLTGQVSQTANLLLLAQLMTEAALLRQESRGAHYRLDYPQLRNDLALHLTFEKGEAPAWTTLDDSTVSQATLGVGALAS
jgi:L-aspartate oxidase